MCFLSCRYPQGKGNPSFLIGQLSPAASDNSSSVSSNINSSSQHSGHKNYIRLGESLDKHLCFYGSCSLAVLQPQLDAELVLAVISVAMREMHR